MMVPLQRNMGEAGHPVVLHPWVKAFSRERRYWDRVKQITIKATSIIIQTVSTSIQWLYRIRLHIYIKCIRNKNTCSEGLKWFVTECKPTTTCCSRLIVWPGGWWKCHCEDLAGQKLAIVHLQNIYCIKMYENGNKSVQYIECYKYNL